MKINKWALLFALLFTVAIVASIFFCVYVFNYIEENVKYGNAIVGSIATSYMVYYIYDKLKKGDERKDKKN